MDIVSARLNVSEDKLSDYAASAARLLNIGGAVSARGDRRRLVSEWRELRRSHRRLAADGERREETDAAEEWLLDNYYLIAREAQSALGQLRSAAPQRCADGESLGFVLCRAFLRSGGGRFDEGRLRTFLDGFQSVCPLHRSELDALGAELRCAAVSALAEVCRAMRETGERDAELHAALLGELFSTLRRLASTDFEELTRGVDPADIALCADATGEYVRMDGATRKDYLRRLAQLARQRGMEEEALARELTERSKREGRHVGFFLFDEKPSGGEGFIAATAALTAAGALALGFVLGPLAALGLLVTLSDASVRLCALALLRFVRPRRLPRMDLSRGIPPEGRSVCVISGLLTDGHSVRALAGALERMYFSCGAQREKGTLCFALLADLKGAPTQDTDGDAELIAAARTEIDRLNAAHGGGFALLTRRRSFDGESWCGRERKRGALIALAREMCRPDGAERDPDAPEIYGDGTLIHGARFILTVDSDTVTYPGSMRELIGAALHPLCRVRIDGARGVVTGGHGIIQPRIGVTLSSALRTDFSTIFAGTGGSDPYGALSGELYMDAFSSGGFAGKGLIDASALLECTERRFEGRGVLSHDAPEGAYLRAAFMGDEEFFDAFPGSPAAWARRQSRWVRGDWQNLRFVFARELPPLERWRLFDKLRQSLVAPATLAVLLWGFFDPRRAGAAAAAAVLGLIAELLPALARELTERRDGRPRRYARVLAGFGGAIVRNFMRLWLLPWEAWIDLAAAATALWRTGVTHRRLLQWETAAQSEHRGESVGDYARCMFPALPAGLAAMLFSPLVIGRAAGLMWLLSPLAAWALGLEAQRPHKLSSADGEYIRAAATDTWRYFTTFSTKADNYLPPDNYQLRPAAGAAHSVSPTNLGLALVAAVAACDLGAASSGEAIGYIRRVLSTAELMERYRGHFYNWYDTRTLLPLRPEYVSTVDSGNLCACLIVAAAFCDEQGQSELAARLRKLADGTDMSFLYDPTRSLFHICYDTEKQRGAGGWYDLMASEAVTASFIACARGEVPRRHWRALGRSLLRCEGYRGLASWSGTMFEYLMSALFLPLRRGSLMYESARFCLFAQRRAISPWGMSESAFFSLDASGRYRYKAHGAAALALRRGAGQDRVVSPYSAFLALAVEPRAAADDLRALEELGMRSRFGFYEALDLTPSRCFSPQGERVCCHMAHHSAMSLAAAANALCGGSISRRFMSDPRMAAFAPLTEERLEGGTVLRRGSVDTETPPPRPHRRAQRSGTRGERGWGLLSNGAATLLCDEMGLCDLRAGDISVLDSRFGGLSIVVHGGGRELRLLPSVPERWVTDESHCGFNFDAMGLKCELDLSVPDEGRGLLVELRPRAPIEGTLELSFTPLLAPLRDYLDHPAFSALGMTAQLRGDTLVLRRISARGGDIFLACAVSRRGAAFPDGRAAAAQFSAEEGAETVTDGAALIYPRVRIRTEYLAGGELRLALCLSDSAAEAAQGAERILRATAAERSRFVGSAAALLALSAQSALGAADIAGAIRGFRPRGAAPRSELWRRSLSGDRPLLLCPAGAKEEEELISRFCLLKSCGVDCELVLTTDEGGEYPQATRQRVLRTLSRSALEPLLDADGGVRLLPSESFPTLATRSALVIGAARRERESMPSLPGGRRSGGEMRGAFDGEGGYVFTTSGALPRRPWQNLLWGGGAGWLAVDCGSGYMWRDNAREARISPPPLTPQSVCGAEQLWVSTGRGRVSLFAADDGIDCRVSFSGAAARWEKTVDGRRVTLTGFVDPDSGARVLILGGAQGLEVCWRMETVLGTDGAAVSCSFDGRRFRAVNAEGALAGRAFFAAASVSARCRCDWVQSGMLFSFTASDAVVLACGIVDEEKLFALLEREAALHALSAAVSRERKRMRAFSLRCSDAALEHYMNGWCLRQIYARIEARCSIYQSGGAWGFRDQLQDTVNLLLVDTDSARRRILDCCAHQYAEGDVMHWWHALPDGDLGLRSRCSDDMLWLPWALCEYVRASGDVSVCGETAPYLSSPPLGEKEKDRCERAPRAGSGTVTEHALRALDCCIGRGFGPHGLPLMLAGDWNDSLDQCGGESVWLGFFLCYTARETARLMRTLGRAEDAKRLAGVSRRMLEACEGAYNGRWYERGWASHGDLSRGGQRIDSIVQSWAVFCGAKHAREALENALCRLVDGRTGIVKLLDPPFSPDEERFGYISAYGEGCRENGGQYTHAAVWLARACFKVGRADAGREILSLLLPEWRGALYGGEPYVLPADVCAAPGHVGEAMWTWYTGSAGWYFRTVCEGLLGLRRVGGRVVRTNVPGCAGLEIYGVRVFGEEPRAEGE